MGTVSKTHTAASGAVIPSSGINTNFDTLYTLVNGNVDNDNVKASAGIVATKLNLATIAQAIAMNASLTMGSIFKFTKGSDVASATTTVIGSDGNYFDITGTTTITSFTVGAGTLFMLQFDDALTLTHHATNLDLPSEANITTVAGDTLIGFATAANAVQVLQYTRATGKAVVETDSSILTLGTPQASTSGTEIDFTGIPSGTKRITVMGSGVSLSGAEDIRVQLGDSGGFETSGYSGGMGEDGAAARTSNSDGFRVVNSDAGGDVMQFKCVLDLENSSAFTWNQFSISNKDGNQANYMSSGNKSLSAELTQVRVTMDGAVTFDAGNININYE